MTDVRKAIRKALKESGKTRYWLAIKTGIRISTVYTFLAGKRPVNSDMVKLMFDALGLEIQPKEKR